MIINGELKTGPRRRRLPGLDDDLQRGLRGRAVDHRADEPRAVHQPLPTRARRDGELSRHRPQVRQRHRSLALAAHVRRLVFADGGALRHSAEPPRRERRLSARRTGASDGQAGTRPESPRRGGRARGVRDQPSRSTSVRRRVYTSDGKLLYDHTWYSSYRSEPRIIREGTSPKPEPEPPPPPKKKVPPPPPPPRRAAPRRLPS